MYFQINATNHPTLPKLECQPVETLLEFWISSEDNFEFQELLTSIIPQLSLWGQKQTDMVLHILTIKLICVCPSEAAGWMITNFFSVLSGLVLPLWASPVIVPSPAGLPSWSRHFQSMPRTTRAPGTMYFITWERNRRRWRRRFASASFTALPANTEGRFNEDIREEDHPLVTEDKKKKIYRSLNILAKERKTRWQPHRAGPHRRRWWCHTARVQTEIGSESDHWRSSPSVWS